MIWALCSAVGIIPMLVVLWAIGSICEDCSNTISEESEFTL